MRALWPRLFRYDTIWISSPKNNATNNRLNIVLTKVPKRLIGTLDVICLVEMRAHVFLFKYLRECTPDKALQTARIWANKIYYYLNSFRIGISTWRNSLKHSSVTLRHCYSEILQNRFERKKNFVEKNSLIPSWSLLPHF